MNRRKESSIMQQKNFVISEESSLTQASSLNRIFITVNKEGFSPEVLATLGEELELIRKCFGIDTEGAVLMAAILEKTSTNNPIDDEDLASYLGCTNIEFIRFHKEIRSMEKAGIISSDSCGRGRSRTYYRVSQEALKAIEKNGEFSPAKITGLTSEEVFIRFGKFFRDFKVNSIDVDRLTEELDSIIENNTHLVFCRKVLDSPLNSRCSETEKRMFYYLCQQYFCGTKSVGIDILLNFTEYFEDDDFIKGYFSRERTNLQENGLVCFAIEDGFVDPTSLSLSDKVKEEFFCEVEISHDETVIRHRDIIGHETIKAKELFFNDEEDVQVSRLENLLEDENFRKVQERLVNSGMRKGFNAIFYGAPGTGKTASVYELARKSGRDIFKVDMSKLKSKWVGDSEKTVKAVFKMYKSLCHRSAKAPILLFNEADAIFSKRLDNVEQSVDQMNNAIQNIILDELENIEGILIATTNLLSNLDPAFERRFIFKVEFKLPEKDCRAKIWKSMIPGISKEDASILADRYTFSGGNIENIARKSTVEYVLSGNEPTLSSLDLYCREELLGESSTKKKIGFQA